MLANDWAERRAVRDPNEADLSILSTSYLVQRRRAARPLQPLVRPNVDVWRCAKL